MKSITINGIDIQYTIESEEEELFDKNGSPGTPGYSEIVIQSPEHLIGNDYFIQKIIQYECFS